jgi:thiamine biosynthesis protein ThiS
MPEPTPSITLKVNGEGREVPAGMLLNELLQSLGERFEGRSVAVAVNLDIVPREQHAEHALKQGDRVDVVTAVGGG